MSAINCKGFYKYYSLRTKTTHFVPLVSLQNQGNFIIRIKNLRNVKVNEYIFSKHAKFA